MGVGAKKVPPTPTAGRTIISMKVLSGSSSRGLTSMGPETEAMAVVAPYLNVAEPSARGRRESVAVMAMVVAVLFGGEVGWRRKGFEVGRAAFLNFSVIYVSTDVTTETTDATKYATRFDTTNFVP